MCYVSITPLSECQYKNNIQVFKPPGLADSQIFEPETVLCSRQIPSKDKCYSKAWNGRCHGNNNPKRSKVCKVGMENKNLILSMVKE